MARQEGEVVERHWKRGRGYALRFRAYGERRYVSLGFERDGWDRRRAEEELQNILADVRRGLWVPPRRGTARDRDGGWEEREVGVVDMQRSCAEVPGRCIRIMFCQGYSLYGHQARYAWMRMVSCWCGRACKTLLHRPMGGALIPGLRAIEKYRGEQSGWAHQAHYWRTSLRT